MNIAGLKRSQLEHIAQQREHLRRSPHLRWLFFEITNRCNLECRHCGSSCSSEGQSLTKEDVETTLLSVRRDRPMICLTGGEPLLHPDFWGIAECVRSSGFSWGMTTNATLIDEAAASKLRLAGMSTVSVSLDGMERSHDTLRQRKGAWRLAIRGLKALQEAGFKPQVTTVVHHENIEDLEPLYALLSEINREDVIISSKRDRADVLIDSEDYETAYTLLSEIGDNDRINIKKYEL